MKVRASWSKPKASPSELEAFVARAYSFVGQALTFNNEAKSSAVRARSFADVWLRFDGAGGSDAEQAGSSHEAGIADIHGCSWAGI